MKVRELLTDSSKFCTIPTSYACGKHGEHQDVDSPSATRWDLVGAILHCYPLKETHRNVEGKDVVVLVREKIFDRVVKEIKTNLADWNRFATFEDVRKVVDKLDI